VYTDMSVTLQPGVVVYGLLRFRPKLSVEFGLLRPSLGLGRFARDLFGLAGRLVGGIVGRFLNAVFC
jgi:hypothetical protein